MLADFGLASAGTHEHLELALFVVLEVLLVSPEVKYASVELGKECGLAAGKGSVESGGGQAQWGGGNCAKSAIH